MIKVKLSIVILFVSAFLRAQNNDMDFSKQYEVIDTMLIEVEYDFKHNEAPQYDDFLKNDKLFLEIGKSMAHSYSEKERKLDILTEQDLQINNKRRHTSYDSRIGEVYNNHPQGTITVITGLDMAGPFLHTEKIIDFGWKICDEHKQILNYDCVKAICSFRGRDYEAWFATSIPLSYGPWKFGGLPGLILEIYDKKGEYFFVCKGIQKDVGKNITFRKRKYTKVSRANMRKYQNLLHRKPVDFCAMYGRTIYTENGPITNEQWGYERNVIEKE